MALVSQSGWPLPRLSWFSPPGSASEWAFSLRANRRQSKKPEAPTAQSVEAELRQAEEHYQKAISGLEQIAKTERGASSILEQPIPCRPIWPSSIKQSARAGRHCERKPNSEPAQQSLLASFKAKIGLLQETVALINEMRKGNEAGAARIVSGLQQQ